LDAIAFVYWSNYQQNKITRLQKSKSSANFFCARILHKVS
jgi:hypothetical protein